jgi:arylamine N-acetyltransferase
MEHLLNTAELDEFLVKYLRIPDWKVQFETNKWNLLKLITRRYGIHPKFSFQNVTMASLPPEKRRAPTKEDSKLKCMYGKGGMCIEHNYFFASILASIGFDAYVVGASVSLLPDIPLCHPVCVIRDGDLLQMVDFGMGAPFPYEPIPLRNGKDVPYYTYKAGGYLVEYRVTEEGICQRVHIKGDPLKGEYRTNSEEIRTVTDLKPKEFEAFEPAMTTIFTQNESYFLRNLYIFKYLETTDEDFKAILFCGTKVMEITKNTLKVDEYEQYEDVYPIFEKFCPELNMGELCKAVETFRTNFPEAGK